jgi:hypothetical protein
MPGWGETGPDADDTTPASRLPPTYADLPGLPPMLGVWAETALIGNKELLLATQRRLPAQTEPWQRMP